MVPKLMGELRNRREIRTGRWMPAIVEQLKPESATLRVKRGEAVLLLENAEWARPFDPRKNGTGLKLDEFGHILRRGDVILVERLERERLNEGIRTGPFQVALVQEPDVQAAAVVIEPSTGAIRAMAGGYDFERSQFNRAYQAVRPPGSAFKPVVYSAAISEGWTPSDIMMDTPIIFPRNGPRGLWKPTNFEEKSYGPTTLRDALTHSRNVVTVKLANSVGISKVVRRARQFGIRSPLQSNLSLALGSSGVTLLELTSLYGTLANRGRHVEPHVIDFVENSDGRHHLGRHPDRGAVRSARGGLRHAQSSPGRHSIRHRSESKGAGPSSRRKNWNDQRLPGRLVRRDVPAVLHRRLGRNGRQDHYRKGRNRLPRRPADLDGYHGVDTRRPTPPEFQASPESAARHHRPPDGSSGAARGGGLGRPGLCSGV